MNAGIEIILIMLLIIINGFFALSEMALVGSRKIRLKTLSEKGDRRARIALKLKESPSCFFSTVQIGITLVGIVIGVASGATLAHRLEGFFAGVSFLEPYSSSLSMAAVIILVTFLTLIFGELAPKQLAIVNPERFARLTAPFMNLLQQMALPAVFVLSAATRMAVRLLGIKPSGKTVATEEDIRGLIKEAALHGEVEHSEKFLLERVFRLNDRQARAIMTDRSKIVSIDIDAPSEENLEIIMRNPHARFPVVRGELGKIIGAIKAKEYLGACLREKKPDLRAFLHQPLYVPETMHALNLLELFRRRSQMHLAIVVNEQGEPQGIITLNDILEAIVGELAESDMMAPEPAAVRRDDGSWLLDGLMPIEEVLAVLKMDPCLVEPRTDIQNLADFVLCQMGTIPRMGEHFDWNGFRFEVVDLDGRRIDRILAKSIQP